MIISPVASATPNARRWGKSASMPPRPGSPPRAWQRMLSGRRLDLLDPAALDVEIEDIAHGLARVARWNGQTRGPHIFSVAQHSLFVESIARHARPDLSEKACLAVLLHDAAEYVIGDIISPFKAVLGDAYKGVEHRILAAVMIRFSLPPTMPASVSKSAKAADLVAAYHEATVLAGFNATEAQKFFGKPTALPPVLMAMLEPWAATEAEERFLARFSAITHALD